MTVEELREKLRSFDNEAIVVVSVINPNSAWNEAAVVTAGTLPSGEPMVMVMG